MNKAIMIIGAVIVAAILVFVVLGGLANPYVEEDLGTTNINSKIRMSAFVIDVEGEKHMVPLDNPLTLLQNGVEFTSLGYQLEVKVDNDEIAPGVYSDFTSCEFTFNDFETHSYVLDSLGEQSWFRTATWYTRDPVTVPVGDGQWHILGVTIEELDTIDEDIYSGGELVYEACEEGDYQFKMYCGEPIGYTPLPSGTPSEVIPPDTEIFIDFTIAYGDLIFDWQGGQG